MIVSKNSVIGLILPASLLLLNCKESEAQQAQNEIVVSANVGYSMMGTAISSTPIGNQLIVGGFTNFQPYGKESTVSDISVDWGINDRYSLGGGIAYQTLLFNPEIISRLNIGLRLLYHFGKERNIWNGRLDEYIGFRPGISFWDDKNYYNNLQHIPTLFKASFVLPSIQFLVGMRLYPLHNLAIQIEGAIGTPYFINVGLSYRINRKSSSPQGTPAQNNYGGHDVK